MCRLDMQFTCLMTSNLRTALLPFKCTLIRLIRLPLVVGASLIPLFGHKRSPDLYLPRILARSFVVNKAFVLYVGQLLNAFISSETVKNNLFACLPPVMLFMLTR